MATGTLEERVTLLEKKNAELELKVERNRATVECTRMVNRFCYLNNQSVVSKNKPISDMFALDEPDVRVQLGQIGVFEGKEQVLKIYGSKTMSGGAPRKMPPGSLFLHPLASVYVEVAKDLKTAKGVCLSIGIESGNTIETAAWGWGSYGIDFIQVNGEWKMWHFHIYRIFRAPYLKSWVAFDPDAEGRGPTAENAPPPGEGEEEHGGPMMDMKPTRPGKDDYPYRANEVYVFKPDPPDPYETFDPKTGY